MLAVIETGGKQYKVKNNDVIKIEKLDEEAGTEVKFEKVLMLYKDNKLALESDLLKAVVTGKVISQVRDEKVIIFKKRRRKNSRRKTGHRQTVSYVKITSVG